MLGVEVFSEGGEAERRVAAVRTDMLQPRLAAVGQLPVILSKNKTFLDMNFLMTKLSSIFPSTLLKQTRFQEITTLVNQLK